MKLLTTRICMYSDVGVHGSLFGGTILAWLGEAGTAFACEHCGSPRMVTKRISEVVFERSVKPGAIIQIYGKLVSVGTTSLSVHIEAHSRDPEADREELVCKLETVFVHVDGQGEPCALRWTAHKHGALARRVALVAPGPVSTFRAARIHPAPDSSATAS